MGGGGGKGTGGQIRGNCTWGGAEEPGNSREGGRNRQLAANFSRGQIQREGTARIDGRARFWRLSVSGGGGRLRCGVELRIVELRFGEKIVMGWTDNGLM